MRVRVLYFGVLRERLGGGEAWLELREGAIVGEVLNVYREQIVGFPWDSIAVAVNQEYAKADVVLKDGDEVALLPPVSGGFGAEGLNGMRVEIIERVIPSAEIVAEMKTGPDGAVCVFDGIVRDNSRGRKTLHLDYEAYREMALDQMRGLAGEAVTRFGVRDVALVHRLGRLMVGETSVLVVVASAHRGAAFDACRWLIDTLKKTVPIWKKEQFLDGAIWADGEPFPDAVAVGLNEKGGRPSGEAHVPESGRGAPGAVESGRLGK